MLTIDNPQLSITGGKLKNLRLQYGLSQNLLAQMIGATETDLERWENCFQTVPAEFVHRIFDVTILNDARKEILKIPAMQGCELNFTITVLPYKKIVTDLYFWGS